MSITQLSLRASALALLLAVTMSHGGEAIAASRAPSLTSGHTATDSSAAQRHHHAQRNKLRNAYGAYVGGADDRAPSPLPYGYGVGDNARNQTW